MPKTIETGQVPDSEFKHKVLNLETGVTKAWAIQEMLQMINRDRSEEWSDYDADDYVEGWVEWVEGDFYALRITPDDLANMAVSARIDVTCNLKSFNNAAELAAKLSEDPDSSVRFNLTHNLAGLSNLADLTVKLNQDPSKEVRTALAYSLTDPTIAAELELKPTQDGEEYVRNNVDSQLMNSLAVTFHLPCDNQTPTGHEANLSLTLNQNDINRLDDLKATLSNLNAYSMDVEPDTKNNGHLEIALEGVTFNSDSNEAGIYRSTLKITKDESISVHALSSNGNAFESYDGLTLDHLKEAYTQAIEHGAKHVTINDGLEAQFTEQKPAVINEQSLFNINVNEIEGSVCESVSLYGSESSTPLVSTNEPGA